jgi:hypothetical protein
MIKLKERLIYKINDHEQVAKKYKHFPMLNENYLNRKMKNVREIKYLDQTDT